MCFLFFLVIIFFLFFLSFGEQTEGSWFNCTSCCFSGWMGRRPISNGLSSLWARRRPPAWSQDWVLILFPWKLSGQDCSQEHNIQYVWYQFGVFFSNSTLGHKFCRYRKSSIFQWNHSFSGHSQAKLRLWLSQHGKTYIFKYISKYTANILDKISFKIYLSVVDSAKAIFSLWFFNVSV